MRINRKSTEGVTTHEGAKARRTRPADELRRTVATCLLWENSFDESGQSIADRIIAALPLVEPSLAAEVACEARNRNYIRHTPLLIAVELAKLGGRHAAVVRGLLNDIIQRAAEMAETLAIYWGKSIVVIDVSGSMYGGSISEKSTVDRAQAACQLGAFLREVCEDVSVYATAGDDGARVHQTKLIPARHGMALSEAIHGMCNPLGGGGIFLYQVCEWIKEREDEADRIIVVTDEQDCDDLNDARSPSKADAFGTNNYIINIGGYGDRSINFGKWVTVSGWSENIVKFVLEYERLGGQQSQ